ncbi:MAG: biopolymer transporter ExbD [Verrucomicrobiae bacterium]|nr:biopolymer transporter ExbD [Verrucomicrobiae bacterium]MDW8344424.1 biopolymer transporter ExbD [Verrucomicrobiae bacterium]
MKLKRRKIKRGRIEIIPMIDTIVILLIFYMTFSRFVEAAREGAIKLPESRAGQTLELRSGHVVVNLIEKDTIIVDKVEYRLAQLPQLLQLFREKLAKDEQITVVLRADRHNVTYRDISEFMKMCAKAGVINVTFATLEATK